MEAAYGSERSKDTIAEESECSERWEHSFAGEQIASSASMLQKDIPEDALNLLPDQDQRPGSRETGPHPLIIKWPNVLRMLVLHVCAIYGIILIPSTDRGTLIWALFLYFAGALGITAGAHRLWSHRSYKAKLPYRILVMILNCIAFQNDVIDWSRNHRAHHKFSETDGDPHNAKRGFFFSHVGWLMVKKHPDVTTKGRQLDIQDLLADPVLRFQRRFYIPLVLLFCFVLPTITPKAVLGQSLWNSFFVAGVLRYVAFLHATWLVNSAAHMWGWKPYDKDINPAENLAVAALVAGEGFHNFHHSFPQDYSTGEFGWFLNLSTLFIDIFAFLGQVVDRKCMPKHLIERKKKRSGVGS